MLPLYTLCQLRQIEQAADKAGIDLMQRAARSAADWISQHYANNSHILIAVGTGNNGGDGLWAGLNLHARDYQVTLYIPQLVTSPAALKALALCRANQIPEITRLDQLTGKIDLIMDGLFGIGLNRSLSEGWQQIINQLNALKLPILALDTPSGLDAYTGTIYGTAIKAKATLTFLGDKPALHTEEGKHFAGEILVDILDLPKSMIPKD